MTWLSPRLIQHLSIFFQNFQYKIQHTRKQGQPQNPVVLHFYSHKIKRIPDVMKDKQQQENCKNTILLFLKNFLKAKRIFWFHPVFGWRNKRWSCCSPVQIRLSELTTQKLLFGIHDSFIINPVSQHKNKDKPNIGD